MASHVTVIATDLRRTTVKVHPGTYMADVLQEACKKLGLSSDKYLLKHKVKNVDLSVVWRQAGLSPGAKLELVQKSKTPSAVSVALQLPSPESNLTPNGRMVDKFPSTLSIWKVLRQFESSATGQGKNLNITARGVAQTQAGKQSGSGQLFYEMPVLNIMGRELASFDDLQKTLSHLGYNSGSVLMRLSFKMTEKTLFEAMSEFSQFFSEEEEKEKGLESAAPQPQTKAPTEAPTPTQDPQATTESIPRLEPQPIDILSAEEQTSHNPEASVSNPAASQTHSMDVDPQVPLDSLQPVGIFQAPSGNTPAAALAEVSETDYTPTIAHAQLHQARLLQSSQNKRLLSDRELEEQAKAEEDKLTSVASVAIKVRFPDNTSAQWMFGPDATGAALYKGVRSVMANETQQFRLLLPGGKTIVKDSDAPSNRLIHDYKLTQNVLINLFWDDSVPAKARTQPFLKGSVAQRATAVQVPDLPQAEEEEGEGRRIVQAPKQDNGGKSEGSMSKKLPKWLKLPGKK